MNENELDRQLRMALHAECSPESVARLELFGAGNGVEEARRRMLRRCTAHSGVAGSLASAITILSWNTEQAEQAPVIVEAAPEPPRVEQQVASAMPAVSASLRDASRRRMKR